MIGFTAVQWQGLSGLWGERQNWERGGKNRTLEEAEMVAASGSGILQHGPP